MNRNYEKELDELADQRDKAEQFSDDWFRLVAEIEDLRDEASRHQPLTPVPADFVDIDWDKYDDE